MYWNFSNKKKYNEIPSYNHYSANENYMHNISLIKWELSR